MLFEARASCAIVTGGAATPAGAAAAEHSASTRARLDSATLNASAFPVLRHQEVHVVPVELCKARKIADPVLVINQFGAPRIDEGESKLKFGSARALVVCADQEIRQPAPRLEHETGRLRVFELFGRLNYRAVNCSLGSTAVLLRRSGQH